MAAAKFTNKGNGALIFYDRRGAEVYLERGGSVTCDIDVDHPPIRAWLNEGRMVRDGEADPAELARAATEEASRLEAQRRDTDARLAADAQAGSVTIIAGDPRPIS
ncbi:MAG: hypothetical protein IPK75_12765 [Acidobacteria bacterium]|nr:hypothetical protein [Acidobacteriota bacterium]